MSAILITGAAGGIGRELVHRAIARGDTVVAAVRNQADRTGFDAHMNLHFVLMDVADSRSVETGFAQVDQVLCDHRLDAVVHCAAIAKPNVIEIATVEEFEDTFNTNTLGTLRVLKAALPRLRGHWGRLVLLSSLWGRASGPMVGAYAASKHAIESVADTARRETAGMGLYIVVIEPGVVKTVMLTSQIEASEATLASMSSPHNTLYRYLYQRYAKLTEDSLRTAITPAQCATAIEKALSSRRPRPRYRVGADSKIVCFLAWLLPDRWMDALMLQSLSNRPGRLPRKLRKV